MKVPKIYTEIKKYNGGCDDFFDKMTMDEDCMNIQCNGAPHYRETHSFWEPMFGVWVDGSLAGFIHGNVETSLCRSKMHELYIAPDYRRAGLGKMLIQHFEKFVMLHFPTTRVFMTHIYQSNANMLDLVESLGYERTGFSMYQRINKDLSYEGFAIMTKEI